MKALTKADIVAVPFAPVLIPVPQLGDDVGVFVRLMSGKEREEFQRVVKDVESNHVVTLKAIVQCVCDEATGSRMFASDEEADATIRNPDAIAHLGMEILRANGLIKSSLDDAKKN